MSDATRCSAHHRTGSRSGRQASWAVPKRSPAEAATCRPCGPAVKGLLHPTPFRLELTLGDQPGPGDPHRVLVTVQQDEPRLLPDAPHQTTGAALVMPRKVKRMRIIPNRKKKSSNSYRLAGSQFHE